MKPETPEWYKSMQSNPLKTETFSQQLAFKIKSEALSPSIKKGSLPRRLSLISFSILAGVIGLMLLINKTEILESLQSNAVPSSNGLASINDSASSNSSESVPTSAAGPLSTQPGQTPTDEEWEALINKNNPSTYKEFLDKAKINENVTMVFSRKLEEYKDNQSISVGFDYLKWNSGEWKTSQSVFYHMRRDENGVFYFQRGINKEVPEDRLITAWSGLDNNPLLYGMVIDSEISQIRITDGNQEQYSAKIIPHSSDGYTYWYAAMSSREEPYTVESLNAEGQVLTNDVFYSY
ncbi:hypothetical protein ACX93W_22880 [Paenibacillus sp. CAU 1782]